MKPAFSSKFNSLEEIRHRINFLVSGWDEIQFNQSPKQGKWSPAQVIFHLIQVEEFSVNYVNKKIKFPETLKTGGTSAFFRFYLLKFFLLLPLKYKAPAPVSAVPDKLSKNELLMKWENVRKELAKLLDNFPEDLLEKNIFKHLVAGRLNVYQMLDFIKDHLNHHLPQIDPTLSSS